MLTLKICLMFLILQIHLKFTKKTKLHLHVSITQSLQHYTLFVVNKFNFRKYHHKQCYYLTLPPFYWDLDFYVIINYKINSKL